MKTVVDFDECLRDTPRFRLSIEKVETNIDQLEQKLDKVLKNCNAMIDAGKVYVGQQSQFTNSLWELSLYFNEDVEIATYLNKLIQAMQEMNKFHSILLDQASRTIVKDLNGFIKSDVKKVKESRHYFEKISGDLDIALNRNSQVPKSRPMEYEETSNILSATRSCFRHTALDYVHVLTMLQSRRRHEILGSLLSYMHACFTYYHQGSDLAQDLDPFLKDLSEELVKMRTNSGKLEKEMENRHILVTNRDLVPTPGSVSPMMEGYLFKRTSNAFKTWNRRWFYLKDHQLVYRKRSGEEDYTVMEEDLRLCTVKPNVDCERRNCFEVLSPTKSHMLQADSEEMYLAWVTAMQQAIGNAIQRSGSFLSTLEASLQDKGSLSSSSSSSLIPRPAFKSRTRVCEQLLKIPGNDECCDCSSPNPKWASINLGITLCIECSGVHRSLGVHYSKVRSLTLDDWEPEILKVMAELGNKVVNNVYEAVLSPEEFTKPTAKSPNNIREVWIKAKYVDHKFIRPSLTHLSLNDQQQQQHNSRDMHRFRKWSVRKLRRRPRSHDKLKSTIKNHVEDDDDDDSNNLKSVYENVNQEKNDQPDNSVADTLKNTSTLYTQILNKPQKEMDQVSNEIEEENKDIGTEKNKSEESDVLMFGCDLPKPLIESTFELSSDQDSTAGEEEEFADEEDIENLNPDLLLYKAAVAHNLPVMCAALAAGADLLWFNANDNGRTSLHQAIISGSVMSCEYLLLNGARINCQDADGKTPLYLATELGHTAQVCLLLKHRADQHIHDKNGIKPLSIAVREANADIVTLLRLGLLNEEMKDSEVGITGDETFNDVVRDFSQLACSHPERLHRRNDSNSQNTPG